MDKEIKKKVTLIGEPGQNRAEVIEEEKSAQSLDAKHAQSLMREAGELYKPLGSKYLGSATIHYYSKEAIASNPQFFVACQTNIGNVQEQHCSLGWKQLQSAMMKAFGRVEPKTTN